MTEEMPLFDPPAGNDSKLSELIIQDIKNSQTLLQEAKCIKTFQGASDFLHEVVEKVEQYSEKVKKLSSNEKIKTAVEVINFFVDVPYVPEFLEEKIISLLICSLVAFLNKTFGHDWLEKIKQFKFKK
jgi:hypothetical protein